MSEFKIGAAGPPIPAGSAEAHGVQAPAGGAHPVTIEVQVRLQAIAIPEAGGGYSIIVPALPGCVSDADSLEEAQANAVEAAEGWLGVQHDRGKGEAIRVALGGEEAPRGSGA